MTEYVPYTYRLFHSITKTYYYGSRYANSSRNGIANPNDLFVSYFTSSKTVKKLIKEYGMESFQIKITNTFKSAEAARRWECKFLSRIDVARRSNWINSHNGGETFYHTGSHSLETVEKLKIVAKRKRVLSPEAREKLIARNKAKVWTPEMKQKISHANTGHKYNVGVPHTDERKHKIGSSNKGKVRSQDTLYKLSNAQSERWAKVRAAKQKQDTIDIGKPLQIVET